MGRRRKPDKVPLTSIAISVDILETISRLKLRRETYDHLIKRLVAEWRDLKEYRLDMDQVLRLKDRQISMLENELKEKLEQQNKNL
ncbi:MAG TPA: hypothetical protein VFR65_01075 [Nitrososphaeraceae archaeon]|nr:hypothetical protein [Nitrososphaeraceae archaeon]